MSLILEALKRSEQERRRERVPDLRTVHQPLLAAPARPFPWRLVLTGLLVLNLNAFGIWWLLQRDAPAAATGQVARTPEQHELAAAAAVPPAEEATGRVERATPRSTPSEISVANSTPADALPSSPVLPAASRPPVRSLTELSPAQRASLPAMTFSFHVFSDNPGRRSIIINERRLGEGEEVAPGWWLEEITAEGVVLAGADERLYIPVLSQW